MYTTIFFKFVPLLLLLGPPFFPTTYSIHIHHPVNQDDQHLQAQQWHLTSQSHGSFLNENNCFFLLRIKLHAMYMLSLSFTIAKPPKKDFRSVFRSWCEDITFAEEIFFATLIRVSRDIFAKTGKVVQGQENIVLFVTRDRCYDYLNIFGEIFCEKISVFDSKQS
jgi:hypothetical protein